MARVATAERTLVPASPRDLFGQPRGLWVLAGTELWDRISFHGMQAMLVLYMTGDLLVHPERMRSIIGFATYRPMVEAMTGPLGDTALATQTFGFYLAFVTGLPLIGGLIGDRLTGRRLAVGLGAGLMTAGHFYRGKWRNYAVSALPNLTRCYQHPVKPAEKLDAPVREVCI